MAFLIYKSECRRPDLNRHGRGPLPPQDSVSTKFHHFGIDYYYFFDGSAVFAGSPFLLELSTGLSEVS